MNKYDKFKKNMPKLFKVGTNPIISALVQGFAVADEDIATALEETKAQLFVKTATGKYLDVLAGDYGVRRPVVLGMIDEDFRELIPNLSIKAKQIRKAFYDTMRIFWGDLYQKANITSVNSEPYNIIVGDILNLKIDGQTTETLQILTGDLKTSGAATASELVSLINSQITGVTASEMEDPVTGISALNIRTNTPGSTGKIEVLSDSTMISALKLNFDTSKAYQLTDLSQRTVIYEINNREVIIEIPATIPALRRTLKGSHHLHEDGTLEPAIPPANGIWHGSFLWDPNNTDFTISNVRCKLGSAISAGNVYTTLTSDAVDDVSSFPNEPGYLIFNFGLDSEYPVRYLRRVNDRTLLLDPSYTFEKTHLVGSYVNILTDLSGYIPRINGDDYAIYLTSPSSARAEVQALLETLVAAGVTVTFVILLPEYHWISNNDNPYL